MLIATLMLVTAASATPPPITKDCVVLNRVTDQRIADANTIYFRENNRWFRNDIRGGCPGLRPNNAIQTRTTTANLCAGDIVTVFEPASRIEYGSCGLGQFTSVDAPPPRHR